MYQILPKNLLSVLAYFQKMCHIFLNFVYLIKVIVPKLWDIQYFLSDTFFKFPHFSHCLTAEMNHEFVACTPRLLRPLGADGD